MEVTHEELAKDIEWSFHEPPNEERIEDFKAYRELQFEMVKQTPEKPMSADQDQKSEEWYNFEARADYLVFIEDYLSDGKVSDVGFEEVTKIQAHGVISGLTWQAKRFFGGFSKRRSLSEID